MKIGIDVYGGDNAPQAVLDGVKRACANDTENTYLLYGDKHKLAAEYLAGSDFPPNVDFVHCTDIIEADDKPVKAIRKKKDSAVVRACNDLKAGELDVFISAGNTGALLAGGTLLAGRIAGIKRPALTTVYPTSKGMITLLDIGANADCTAENLNQFAMMGSLYSELVLGTENPTVSLVNIGSENTKGSILYQDAYKLLEENAYINFTGNIEARDISEKKADVVVCDGFTGNIILKLTEGLAKTIFSMIKGALMSSFISKIGAALSKSSLKNMKEELDYSRYGGAPLLGLKYPIVKAHGSSNEVAIEHAILYARKYVDSNLVEKLSANVAEIIDKEKNDGGHDGI